MTNLQLMQIEELKLGFGGNVLLPKTPEYEVARRIWNATVDKHPAIIARCASAHDVVRAVNFARERGLPLAVKGGGHNIAGNALCDDGMVIDLSPMKAVEVDPVARRATAEGGATLADLDAATQAHGLAVPVGINSTTGLAGLTLGGGFGWLSRKHGLTSDNLESAEVVTAQGEIVRASASENADLFWALRGGGGNFGVVTRFEFRLHPVGPEVLCGLVVYPLAQARTVLRQYRDHVAQAPDALTVWAVMRLAPPLPFLPAEAHGTPILALAGMYAGEPAEGRRLFEPLRGLGKPVGEFVGVQPYTAWQQTFDPLLTPGARNYWKSNNFVSLDDELIEVVLRYANNLPAPQTEIFLASLGGAASRPAPESSAYAHRDANFVMNVHGRWEDPKDDGTCIAWARAFAEATAPYSTGGVYVNFLTADETARVQAAYGRNYTRLAQVKRKYDPKNLFRINQNIEPAA